MSWFIRSENLMSIGFRIYTQIRRPPLSLADAFLPYSTSNIADNMGRMFCMDAAIKPLREDSKLVGIAFTVKTRPGDNLLVHKALDMALPGDVIVVDAQGDMTNSILGEIMVRYALKKGLRGFVIDGAVRDWAGIKQLDLPVFAKGASPRGPYKDGPGEINVPISCGGVAVYPGDIIVGDADGVVVIPAKEAEEVLRRTSELAAREQAIFQQVEEGTWDRRWVDEILQQKGCEILETVWS
ncbi:RraA family protein [Thermanaeromonas sp.]|uniref:RraA family protein n=1 Tax=Thermanaeromonas sp. TaxID=2003697 RepID=UPI003446C9B3